MMKIQQTFSALHFKTFEFKNIQRTSFMKDISHGVMMDAPELIAAGSVKQDHQMFGIFSVQSTIIRG